MPGKGQTSWKTGRGLLVLNPHREETDSSFQLGPLDPQLGETCHSPLPVLTRASRGWGQQRRKFSSCRQLKTSSALSLKHFPTSHSSTSHGGPSFPHAERQVVPHTIWMPSSSAVFCRRSMTFSSSSVASPPPAAPCSSDELLAMT